MYAQLIAVSKNLHAFLINKSIIFLEFSVTLNIALFDNTLNNCSANLYAAAEHIPDQKLIINLYAAAEHIPDQKLIIISLIHKN